MARHNFSANTKRLARKRSGGFCEAVGCAKPTFRRGLCSMHLSRLTRHGSVEASGNKPANGAPLTWVLEHLAHEGLDCLVYTPIRGKVTMADGRRVMVHQAMCELAHGPKPTPEHEVAHNCGKGHLGCANSGHIRWSTHVDNLADRVDHGTANRGERHGLSRFTADEVREMKRRLAVGDLQKSIAADFGCQQSTISKISRGERWGWLDA